MRLLNELNVTDVLTKMHPKEFWKATLVHLQGRVHIKVSEGTHDDADAAADADVDDRAADAADGAYTGAADDTDDDADAAADDVDDRADPAADADDDQGGFFIKASGDSVNDDDIEDDVDNDNDEGDMKTWDKFTPTQSIGSPE